MHEMISTILDANWQCWELIYEEVLTVARTISVYGVDAFAFTTCIIIWLPAREFAKSIRAINVKTIGQKEISSILENYEKLKDLSKKMSETAGVVIFTYLIDGMLFYSMNLKSILVWSDKPLYVAFYFLIFFISLCVASDACRRVRRYTENGFGWPKKLI